MSTSKIEIKKIVITIGDKELHLTPEEAGELKNILNELFGENKTVYTPIFVDRYIGTYRQPYYLGDPTYTWNVSSDNTGTFFCENKSGRTTSG
jgi:hypothetical protein